ncbi:MAG: sodium:calcium antiporter [Proteobacteria bacterium]|nr:sodium:calcium antiporter [Pseudomonadota bacterium]
MPNSVWRDWLFLGFSMALPVPWIASRALLGLELTDGSIAVLGGLAILGGAFMISWSCELAERDIPQSLALLVLALVSVLPEYAVDLHFAWTAGKDPSYEPYAVANMTGANRLLIGLGWTTVVLIACWRSRSDELRLDGRQSMELRYLIWATIYSFTIPLKGTLNLLDAVVLLGLFSAYVVAATRSESHEIELAGPPAMIDARCDDLGRRAWGVGLFAFAAYAIFTSAEPFADSLVHIGRTMAVDEFLLVQWVAPLASEAPEFVVAILFALKLRGATGIGALLSSKVNQWTLLVGAIPIAYALSKGAPTGLPLDDRQTQELFLTSAQSLLAAVLLCDLRFQRREGFLLLVLFSAQLLVPHAGIRQAFTVVYLVVAVAVLVFGPTLQRRNFFALALGRPMTPPA